MGGGQKKTVGEKHGAAKGSQRADMFFEGGYVPTQKTNVAVMGKASKNIGEHCCNFLGAYLGKLGWGPKQSSGNYFFCKRSKKTLGRDSNMLKTHYFFSKI